MSYRGQPPRTTSIENFLDLNEIMSSSALPPRNGGNGGMGSGMAISSTDGYPPPPHMNSNFMDQLNTENYERDTAMKPIQGKIRSTNPEAMQLAMNGGSPMSFMGGGGGMGMEYQLGPVARQNLAAVEGYEEAPKPYRAEVSVPKNNPSNTYAESFVMNSPQFNCLDVATHIQKCPLCSKFYDNDKSIYWAAIILLGVTCIYLLKKVIDGKK
jgi:hypothetical protein